VLRAEVEEDPFVARIADDVVPVAAVDVVDAAFGRLTGGAGPQR